MTIEKAIREVDDLKHNAYPMEQKIEWLNELDTRVKQEIIDTHEGADNISFTGYNKETPLTTELLAKTPHDSIYIHYLASMIDLWNGEIVRYNATVLMFTAAYDDFEKWYNSNHMPKSAKMKYF